MRNKVFSAPDSSIGRYLRFHFVGIALNVSSGYIDPLLNGADYYLAMEGFADKLVIAQPPFSSHSMVEVHLKQIEKHFQNVKKEKTKLKRVSYSVYFL